MTVTVQNLVDGTWTGDVGNERRNPADDTEVVAAYPSSGRDAAAQAVSAATAAQAAWAATPAPARGAILMDAAELLRATARGHRP